jgi:general stress protein YciG
LFFLKSRVFCFGGELLTVRSEEKRRDKMTREEAGRIGGQKVARERGSEFYRQIGRKGGEKVAEQRGSEFYREIGKKGGESRGKTTGTKGGRGAKRKIA